MNKITGMRVRFAAIGGWGFWCSMAALGAVPATAATLAPGVQEKLGSATFEVVLAKPEPDPLTYEKPLPLELIPYRERTDKYRSIGTAFAIAPNLFVSAAHVITAGNGSQFGPLALRNAAGAVYPVDKIIKFSGSEDYAVFSLKAPPAVVPLETRSRPPLNSPVFAVGNAFGEGVVARDGLYTSDTPEELDGRWQWLRFSAAASPGNSGGPLVDRNGKVLGVVLRKSPNENLNFALAIGQVLSGDEQNATFELRTSYRLMVMKTADAVNVHEKIPLPKSLDEFYAAARQLAMSWSAKSHVDFLKNHADSIFPSGNSEQLLGTVYAEAFPKLISQSDAGTWALVGDAPKKVQLENNGYIQEATANGVFFVRLRAPDDVGQAGLVADSKKFMDLLLKGYAISRPVGTDAVRVTSMGKSSEESWFTDDYQRRWQIRQWRVPFDDMVLTTVALPTPDGAIMMMAQTPTGLQQLVLQGMQALCGFVYVSYVGTLQQWQSFLADQHTLPSTVANTKVQFDYGRSVAVKTSKFTMLVPATVVKIDAGSVLMLKYGYMRDGATTVWDLGGVYLAEGEQNQRWVGLLRRTSPSAAMPEEITRVWHTMVTGEHPWDGTPFLYNGRSEINALLNQKDVASGKTKVGYALRLNVEGVQPERKMKSDFSVLERDVKVLE